MSKIYDTENFILKGKPLTGGYFDTNVVPKVAKFPTVSRQLANFPTKRESKSVSRLFTTFLCLP